MGENGGKWGGNGDVDNRNGNQVESYQCLFKKGECIDALKAEWEVYWKLPTTASTPNFRILEWWEGMG